MCLCWLPAYLNVYTTGITMWKSVSNLFKHQHGDGLYVCTQTPFHSLHTATLTMFIFSLRENVWQDIPGSLFHAHTGFIAKLACVLSTLCFTAKGLVYTALFSHPERTGGPHRYTISLLMLEFRAQCLSYPFWNCNSPLKLCFSLVWGTQGWTNINNRPNYLLVFISGEGFSTWNELHYSNVSCFMAGTHVACL